MKQALKLDSTQREFGVAELTGATVSADAAIGLDVLPDLLGYNVRRAQIELWRDFGATVAEGEVRPGLFSLLLLVGANPGIAQIDLATQLSVDKASIVALVDRLEEAGWVQRRRSTEDRRRQEIYTTPAGAKRLAQLKREVQEHDAKYCALYTPEELRTFLEFLRR
ncbi:MAG TPA: MarR family transcriptional regulator, partial [Steroidobacteraceae bacterium]|nr:MarR family transcriptional regulator [Steroidobacteraceae bacterium]